MNIVCRKCNWVLVQSLESKCANWMQKGWKIPEYGLKYMLHMYLFTFYTRDISTTSWLIFQWGTDKLWFTPNGNGAFQIRREPQLPCPVDTRNHQYQLKKEPNRLSPISRPIFIPQIKLFDHCDPKYASETKYLQRLPRIFGMWQLKVEKEHSDDTENRKAKH